jgi:hypothetical protein
LLQSHADSQNYFLSHHSLKNMIELGEGACIPTGAGLLHATGHCVKNKSACQPACEHSRLSACLPSCPPLCLYSVCLSASQYCHLSVSVPTSLPLFLSAPYLPACLSVCPLPACLPVCLPPTCLPACLSVSLLICMCRECLLRSKYQ